VGLPSDSAKEPAVTPPITTSVRAPSTPLVAGGVFASYRGTMLERDLWDHTRQAFVARSGMDKEELDRLCEEEWVELSSYSTLLDAMGDTLGLDELRTMIRKRMVDPKSSSFYASMTRSWARSFGSSPEYVLRGVVHIFRAALRNAGQLRAVEIRPCELHLIVEGHAAICARSSQAFGVSLEGLALGFMDLAQPRPTLIEVELAPKREPLALVCKWSS